LEDGNMSILATELTCSYCDGTEFTAEGSDEEGGEDVKTCMSCGSTDFSNTYGFPMWGTMWTFGENIDAEWVRDHGGLEAMQECGFWVYDDEDLGILFGINGGGYDFYEGHWVPLYKKRGLKWHDAETV
jgi:RNA polymerase subunit RPABC4/transcription elongation factor Spt4